MQFCFFVSSTLANWMITTYLKVNPDITYCENKDDSRKCAEPEPINIARSLSPPILRGSRFPLRGLNAAFRARRDNQKMVRVLPGGPAPASSAYATPFLPGAALKRKITRAAAGNLADDVPDPSFRVNKCTLIDLHRPRRASLHCINGARGTRLGIGPSSGI